MASIVLLLSVLIAGISFSSSSQVYIAYMGKKNNHHPDEVSLQNHQLLSVIHGGSMEKAKESHVYSYRNGFRGFAAKLTEVQASDLAGMPGVVSVFPNKRRILHTTHSWDFMGVSGHEEMEIPGVSTENQGNVIIGFIDTGIWPESPSFSDAGMPSIPSRWKGQCQTGDSSSNFTCNKKIIGARYYLSGYEAEQNTKKPDKFESPRDSQGHGSHTASTAAGRFVNNMNYNGLGAGGAHGGAPMARIAVYKSCWDSGCYDADILAAFDDAIKDGVDIISVSLGPDSTQGDYTDDAISIGSFHANGHGILVVASAGNVGGAGTVTNVAPWILTAGATSTDREFASTIDFGNGTTFTGESLNTIKMNEPVRTILASQAKAGYFTPDQASYCLDSSLSATKARGKILVCNNSGTDSGSMKEKAVIVKKAGGVGMILIDETEKRLALPFDIPGATVGKETGDKISSYLNSTRGATSVISPATTITGSRPAPWVASFSSRGPNLWSPAILKPDVVAPGLNILAAWTPEDRGMEYNIASGTSMSCPHISGLAALIKAVQPHWSPAAIKSAIMTTATVLNKNGEIMTSDPGATQASPFDYGSGFPDPTKFTNPGLIYDTQTPDYISFLCGQGYDDGDIQGITGNNKATCNQNPMPASSDLNYPSITVFDMNANYSVARTVTNVGKPRSSYRVSVSPPDGIEVHVEPKYLSFRSYGQKAKFAVNFRVVSYSRALDFVFGSLKWKAVGDVQVVTSVLAVRVPKATSDPKLI
ncbi:uncharacterized protein A4U43_C05F31230 [Asparagus officinalis]|uniref:Subtilisin-like protease n=1 Tax=Asparagus officinalis TaxID=4686 RepID=A0A5P1EWH1_ASPOF|nr:subtilisin-like protease SBT5.4 [Asparagus officinalis]ONK70194.1 uncharacterized protein A4U43_C05F31230 [Asparagus officinalis]